MRPCVLVVDDDVDVREILVEAIGTAGYAVAEARNGREALEWMQQNTACVVLLDLMMPVMDGWQLVLEMEARPELAAVPVCVLTAQTQLAPPRHRALLKKPVSLGELLKVVGAHCGHRAARESLTRRDG